MPEVTVRPERVDDIPLLVGLQCQMGIPPLLDELVKTHGNRRGLSVGWLTAFWLAYIVSQADHRMNVVEGWAESLLETLGGLAGQPVTAKDFTDDCSADLLLILSDDLLWDDLEAGLNKNVIMVYRFPLEAVRLDSTSVAVYHDPEQGTLLRQGYSKDRRPDLAQFKVMLGALDPLGMPLATQIVPGNEADEGLYRTPIERVREAVGERGLLYIGDVKMAALETRALLQVACLPSYRQGEIIT